MVYFALGSLTDTSWYTTQRLGTAMAGLRRVLYIDQPITLNEVLRGRKRWGMFFSATQRYTDNLFWHCPPYLLPYSSRFLAIATFNERLARFRLRAALKQLGITNPVVWLDNPYRQNSIDLCRPALVVYHSLHDYDKQPYQLNPRYAGEKWQRRSAEEELELVRRADLVLSPSEPRLERFRQHNPNSRLLLLGVDFERFDLARNQRVNLPDIDAIPHPRIGFVGTVGPVKIDFDLLLHAAEHNPSWTFVFVGRTFNVTAGKRPLPVHPRLVYLGEKSHVQVPHYLQRFDVSIIPYHPHLIPDLTLKFFEYMAAGHPLVVPELPQFLPYQPLVLCYRDADEFIAAVQRGLDETDGILRSRRIALAADHRFERQAQRADAMIRETLAAKAAHP